ncbi:RNA-dependent RNA polymerase, eukaryotic-type [Corchorus capsularis]|uniref:RNA-dependent RNA polymerase n=1 Tax=Corchorus capsularis TaxID=210143 RepID=A0A1R3HIX0_COCAP|nr:RNA-dependent RNA polymerase, eukaryotic-type [Corchorus capsularis]
MAESHTVIFSGFGSEYKDTHDILEKLLGGVVDTKLVRAIFAVEDENQDTYAIVQFDDEIRVKKLLTHSYPSKEISVRASEDILDRIKPCKEILSKVDFKFGNLLPNGVFEYLWEGVADFVRKDKFIEIIYHDAKRNWWYKLEMPQHIIKRTELSKAPRIFKECKLKRVKDAYRAKSWDRPWEWALDFTDSSLIGQSNCICLGLSSEEKNDSNIAKMEMKEGNPYSYPGSLVPMVWPAMKSSLDTGGSLNTGVLFGINELMHKGILSGPDLDEEFFNKIAAEEVGYIDMALKELSWSDVCVSRDRITEKCCYIQQHYSIPQLPEHPALKIWSVTVTPSRLYMMQQTRMPNRIFCQFGERLGEFLHVKFADEDHNKLKGSMLTCKPKAFSINQYTEVHEKVRSLLKEGLQIGGKKYDFLAYSASQVRKSSLWMFVCNGGESSSHIRDWMGDFSKMKNASKAAARMGQCFSSSLGSIQLDFHEVEGIDDVEDKEFNFSDGIGRISMRFGEDLAKACSLDNSPSAFQIRYAGVKGVVSVHPTSTKKMSIRPSMVKFHSTYQTVDVLSWSKAKPFFLNQQLIILLSALGIRDNVFLAKLREAKGLLELIQTEPLKVLDDPFVCFIGPIINKTRDLLKAGFSREDMFMSMVLEELHYLRWTKLQKKMHIFIPKGKVLMGCLDELGVLRQGQIYIQLTKSDKKDPIVIEEEEVVVARCPSLHPGDVRLLQAINVPALSHMKDCIVFPKHGKRPHPNECSGGDLDGDNYYVCWDRKLIPLMSKPPLSYDSSAVDPNDPSSSIPVSVENIKENFLNFVVSDQVGKISNYHMAFADSEIDGANSPQCKKLAELFAVDIDCAKTGKSVKIPEDLCAAKYPDFMGLKPSYPAKGILGKLYRELEDENVTKRSPVKFYDKKMKVEGMDVYIDNATKVKKEYDDHLRSLMVENEIKNEGRLFLYNKGDDNSFLVQRRLQALVDDVIVKFKESPCENELTKASAWYHITYDAHHKNELISFPWCIHDKLISIIENKK